MDFTHFESLYPIDSRSSEILQILTNIKEGKSCEIIALPGVGRSDTLRLLSYNKDVRTKHLGDNQKWFHFVLLDFSEVRNRSNFDILKFIFLGLADSLRERNLQNEYVLINNLFKDSLSFNDELVLFQGLKQAIDLLSIEKELTVCFLFDKFEEYIPFVAPQFFTNLRILRNRAKYRFSVVFSLNRPIETVLEPTLYADFKELLSSQPVYLALSDKSTLLFRIAYIEKVTEKKLSDNVEKQIIELSAGHGHIIRTGVEALLSEKKVPENLNEFLVENKSVRTVLYSIWNSLTPEEQTVLENSVRAQSEQNDYLKKTGLLKNNDIAIPLLKDLVSYIVKTAKEHTAENHILIDNNTNEIKKGHIVLSDSLTSLEYRLLLFFLQNKERAMERNEIINGVWKNDKTTAGVTDQALDQLILRLRKKIEDNPSVPIHIQTIKGRGIRFTP